MMIQMFQTMKTKYMQKYKESSFFISLFNFVKKGRTLGQLYGLQCGLLLQSCWKELQQKVSSSNANIFSTYFKAMFFYSKIASGEKHI